MLKPSRENRLLLAAFRELVRIAILTLHALQDPDRRYLGWQIIPQVVLRDAAEAYGWESSRLRGFVPTPQNIASMERLMPLLAWLRREEGQSSLKRILRWAVGIPRWRLAQFENCSEKTILNRIDRSLARILHEFGGLDVPIEYVDEPPDGVTHSFVWEYPKGNISGEIKLAKVFIGGRGFWQGGRWLDQHARRSYSQAKAERLAEA